MPGSARIDGLSSLAPWIAAYLLLLPHLCVCHCLCASWATLSQGMYSGYGIAPLYPSSSYLDDLTSAAAQLFAATGEAAYLTQAKQFWAQSLAQEGSQSYKVLSP